MRKPVFIAASKVMLGIPAAGGIGIVLTYIYMLMTGYKKLGEQA